MKEKTRRLFKKQVSVPVLATSVATVTSGLESWVKDSSDKVRQFFFAYLALIAYVLTAVFSTTDKQLLLVNEGLKLPIVDITLPLVGFYVLIPVFILGLHFNLLQNLESHHFKLMELKRAWGGTVPRSHINPLLFDFAVLEDNSLLAGWVRAINSLLCLYSGPIAISVVLWRFADFQSRWILLEHLLILWLDLYFVGQIIKAFKANSDSKINSIQIFPNKIFKRLFNFLTFLVFSPLYASPRTGWMAIWVIVIVLFLIKIIISIATIVIPWHSSNPYGSLDWLNENDTTGWLIPKIKIEPTEILFTPDIKKLEADGAMVGVADWKNYFLNSKAKSLHLSNRRLRFLSMEYQVLPKLIAENAQMQGANLSFSSFQQSKLNNIQLQNSNLNWTNFSNSNLEYSNLQGASISNSDFSFTKLKESRLSRANLSFSNFKSADLSNAHLEGASLSNANFQIAYLTFTKLQGADLSNANFHAARLHSASLQGANLGSTILFGSDLSWSNLLGANLNNTDLQYANLVNANLAGVKLLETKLFMAKGNEEKFYVFSLNNSSKNAINLIQYKILVNNTNIKKIFTNKELDINNLDDDVKKTLLFVMNRTKLVNSKKIFSFIQNDNSSINELIKEFCSMKPIDAEYAVKKKY